METLVGGQWLTRFTAYLKKADQPGTKRLPGSQPTKGMETYLALAGFNVNQQVHSLPKRNGNLTKVCQLPPAQLVHSLPKRNGNVFHWTYEHCPGRVHSLPKRNGNHFLQDSEFARQIVHSLPKRNGNQSIRTVFGL